MNKTKSGFTIVELLIVIVVIGILAAITVVAYNGVQSRALLSALKSDLANAAKQMELSNATNGSYPTALPPDTRSSSGNILSLSQKTGGYCINGESSKSPTIQWHYESTAGGLQEGLCSGAVISGSELGASPNLVTSTDFSTGWHLNFQDGTGRSLTVRPGATGDPFPSRPVLVLNNTSTNPTTWAVLQASSINRAAIQSGKTYTKSYYVRKTGTTYSGGTIMFGVLDGNGLNSSLGTGSYVTTSSNWQRVTETSLASQNTPSSNVLYLPISTSEFTKTGWTIEFQGFELRQQ